MNTTTANVLVMDDTDDDKPTLLIKFKTVFIFIILATFSLNFYLILVILTNKKLHVPVNLIVLSICVVGLILSCLNMPFQLLYLDANFNWTHGIHLCLFWYITDYSILSISILNFIFLTFTRYMSIIRPHNEWVSKKLLIIAVCLIWFVPFTSWTISTNILFHQKGSDNGECFIVLTLAYSIVTDILAFIIPMLVLISLNVLLIIELRKRLKKVDGRNGCRSVEPIHSSMETNGILKTNNFRLVVISNIKLKIRRNVLKKEKKAIISLIILQIGFIVCWTPVLGLFLSSALSLNINSNFYYLLYWLAYMNSLYNAIILICRSDNYQILCRKTTCVILKRKFKSFGNRF